MEPFWVGIIGTIALLVFIVMGVHIAVALSIVGLVGSFFLVGPLAAISSTVTCFYNMSSTYTFVVLPLFVFMGFLAARGGVSKDLYDALSIWMGRARAVMGIATVFACTAFGTVCGAATATSAVFAKVAAPEMRRHNYEKKLAYGICTASGIIGMLIPPSLLMVIYGMLTEESIGKLLIGGVAPGILLTILFSAAIVIIVFRNPAAVGGDKAVIRATWPERFASIKLFWPIIVVATIIFGGIFGGIFSPTEASAVAALVMLIVVTVTLGKNRWRELRLGIFETISTSAMIFLILIGAAVFARFLIFSGVANRVAGAVTGMGLSPIGLLIVLVGVYLILGCFVDVIASISITTPLFYPTVLAAGIDPIWYAMVVILALLVGAVTPPVGLCVYAVKGVAESDVSLEDLFRGSLPFFFAMLIALVILIAFPAISTTLPGLMKGV